MFSCLSTVSYVPTWEEDRGMAEELGRGRDNRVRVGGQVSEGVEERSREAEVD